MLALPPNHPGPIRPSNHTGWSASRTLSFRNTGLFRHTNCSPSSVCMDVITWNLDQSALLTSVLISHPPLLLTPARAKWSLSGPEYLVWKPAPSSLSRPSRSHGCTHTHTHASNLLYPLSLSLSLPLSHLFFFLARAKHLMKDGPPAGLGLCHDLKTGLKFLKRVVTCGGLKIVISVWPFEQGSAGQ